MATKFHPNRDSSLRQMRNDIRSTWSPAERKHRAELAERRRAELFALISAPEASNEIWASGALSLDDLKRIAG